MVNKRKEVSRECIQYSKVQGETKYFTRSVSDRHETKNETRQTTSFQLLFFQPLCRVGRLRFTHIEPTVDRDADSSSLTEHEPIFRDKRYSASTLSHNIEPQPSIVHFQRRKERKKKKETLERFGPYAQRVRSNARRSMQRVSAQTECKLTTDPRHGDPRCP